MGFYCVIIRPSCCSWMGTFVRDVHDVPVGLIHSHPRITILDPTIVLTAESSPCFCFFAGLELNGGHGLGCPGLGLGAPSKRSHRL